MEIQKFKEKTFRNLKLKKEPIIDLLNKYDRLIIDGKIEKLEISNKLSFNFVDYLVESDIKSWSDVKKNRKIEIMRYSGYVGLMFRVAIYAFVKYTSNDINKIIDKSFYDLRKLIFMTRHRGLYGSDDINFDLFCKYLKKYYPDDIKMVKKILEELMGLKIAKKHE